MNTKTRGGRSRMERTVKGYSRGSGFALVEVLVSMAVLAIGLLGLAALQMTGLKAAHSTNQRSQASVFAYEMADRLRANRGVTGVAETALGGAYDGMTLCNSNKRRDGDDRVCSFEPDVGFVPDSMVSMDLFDWWNGIDGTDLSNWYSEIQRSGNMFVIAVQWDDTRAKARDAGSTATKASCLGYDIPMQLAEVCISTQI